MDCPVIKTRLGHMKGLALKKANHKEAKQVFAYLGVPFAKPPVGELRFEPPQKAEPWKGMFDATRFPPAPMQGSFINNLANYLPLPLMENEHPGDYKSEDCLYLNIYSSNVDKTANLPVIVWIHGGGFSFGSSIGTVGQALCGLNDVVLVALQYRVNVFGFFSAGIKTCHKGNMGLLDQVLALHWIRDNIRNFGGNPNNVTLAGESAGAMSVALHVTSPLSRGLFHRAISHSGASTCPTMFSVDSTSLNKMLLEGLDITATEPDDIVKQLKKVDASKIIDVISVNPKIAMFVPTIDGHMIPKHPHQMLAEAKFAKVPYIIGLNNSEGSGLLGFQCPHTFAEGYDKETALAVLKAILAMALPASKIDAVVDAIVETCSADSDVKDKYFWSKLVADVNRDSNFLAPAISQATAHAASGNPTYVYYMTHQSKMHHDKNYSGQGMHKVPFCEADHTDDVIFTFGIPFINSDFLTPGITCSDDERLLSRTWMSALCHFAKTGNPNSGKEGAITWPKYENVGKRHLIMNMPYAEGGCLLSSRCKLWHKTIPKILMSKPLNGSVKKADCKRS